MSLRQVSPVFSFLFHVNAPFSLSFPSLYVSIPYRVVVRVDSRWRMELFLPKCWTLATCHPILHSLFAKFHNHCCVVSGLCRDVIIMCRCVYVPGPFDPVQVACFVPCLQPARKVVQHSEIPISAHVSPGPLTLQHPPLPCTPFGV